MTWHGYIGIEDLGMTAPQRQTLITGLRALGPQQDDHPCHINHWRPRLDGLAAIIETQFEEDTVSKDAIKNRLGVIFGIDPATITDTVTQTAYGPAVKYSRAGDKLRLIQFGGVGSTWDESREAVLAYLRDNIAAWETV